MKKQKSQSLILQKRVISNLDRFVIGGRAASNGCATQDPQTPTAISACRTTCDGANTTRTCD